MTTYPTTTRRSRREQTPGLEATAVAEEIKQASEQRQPPQDGDAEQSVLGGMPLSKDAIADVIGKLRPHDTR